MAEPTREEMLAFLKGKVAWLEYLEQWLEENPGRDDPVQAAWADFQREHPDIARGPGFVRPK